MPADHRISFFIEDGIIGEVEGRLTASESNEGRTHSAASLFGFGIFFKLIDAMSFYHIFKFIRRFLEDSQATIILEWC